MTALSALATLPAAATAAVLAEIPAGDDRKTPPEEVTAGLEQVGRWFFWGVLAALSMAGVLAGVVLAVSYHRHGQLGEGEKRIAAVALAAVMVAGCGGWAAVIL